MTLLLKKGVFPYNYLDSEAHFTETSLPPIDRFFNTLTQQHLSPDDYAHAQNVWKAFNISNLGDYHDLCVLTDILFLTDIFENFRSTCHEQYGLDPAIYYTSPGLSLDAMLKKTGVELELLTDPNMHLFIEKGIRGGVSMIGKKFPSANNPYVDCHSLIRHNRERKHEQVGFGQPYPQRPLWVNNQSQVDEPVRHI